MAAPPSEGQHLLLRLIPWAVLEQMIESPADPEVLLDNGFMDAHDLGSGPLHFSPVVFGPPGHLTHGGPPHVPPVA